MEDKTRLPELTPPLVRYGGVVMIILAAAAPALAWMFASSVFSLAGLLLAVSGWAAIAVLGSLALGSSLDARRMSVLVSACAAFWSVVLSVGFWFLVRREIGVDDPTAPTGGKVLPGEVMALAGMAAAATGATYGYFSAVRYRDLPRAFGRSLRAAAWASLPSLALCVAVFGTQLANRYAAYAVFAPIVLSLVVTAAAMALPRPATA